ncbi:hypothetical protein [Cerasicoccus frondis]|uniref:hypothetical protein n=1 Tax=Cerasicoccus frondis TaxID=490090 RepID=UPI002852A000|nr:hypothetical protein [Cerasicoccus frondis]
MASPANSVCQGIARWLLQACLCLLAALSAPALQASSTPDDWPLAMDLPDGWEARELGDLSDYFNIYNQSKSANLLIEIERKHNVTEADVPTKFSHFMQISDQSMKDHGLEPAEGSETIVIDDGAFQGQAILLKSGSLNDFYTAQVLLNDGRQSLDANFSGHWAEWEEALKILKSIRRHGWNALGPATVLTELPDSHGRMAVQFSRMGSDGRLSYHLSIVKDGEDATQTNGNVAILDQPLTELAWKEPRQLEVTLPRDARVFHRNRFPPRADASVIFIDLATEAVQADQAKMAQQFLDFDPPEPWSFDFVGEGQGQYLFRLPGEQNALLMMHPLKPGMMKSEESAKLQVRLFLDAYPRQIEQNQDVPMEVLETMMYPIKGDVVHGELGLVTLRTEEGTLIVGTFYVTDGEHFYMGQLSGKPGAWPSARDVLESARHIEP